MADGEDWFDIAPAEEIGPGDFRVATVADTPVAVINLGGRFYAVADECSHDFSPIFRTGLAAAELLDGEEIVCPRHGARFCARTGDALTPPAYDPLATFPVRVCRGMVQAGCRKRD